MVKVQGIRKEKVAVSVEPKDALYAIADELGVGCVFDHSYDVSCKWNRTKDGKLKSIEFQVDTSYHGRPRWKTRSRIDDPEDLKVVEAISYLLGKCKENEEQQ